VKRAVLLLASAIALGATPAPPDELIVAEWISTGAHAERHVIPRLQSTIEYLKVDPTGQTRTNAVRLLDERLVTAKGAFRSVGDSVRIFEKGLITAPARAFCEEMVAALEQAGASLDSARIIVADLKRDTTLIDTRGQDLMRPFQALRKISWNTEAQRAQVLAAAERIRAARK
jgi:hypothetical protein